MPKRLIVRLDEGSRQKLQAGINQAVDIVKVTLGEKGRNVALDTDKFRNPLLTNDGVSILRQIHLEDPAEELGVKLVREAASKTEDNAGDGTTTTAILTQAIVNAGQTELEKGTDPLKLRAMLEADRDKVIDFINAEASEARDESTLAAVATISCRDSKIGLLIAPAVTEAGTDGMITLEDNLGGRTEVTRQEGLQLRAGYRARQFINNPALNQVELKHPSFLVTNLALDGIKELEHVANQAVQAGHKILVVFAESIGHEFMLYAYVNWQRPDAPIKILPVPFNTAADIADGMLRDVAAVTGARFIDSYVGEALEQIDQECFGRGASLVQSKYFTSIVPNDKKAVKSRITELKGELKSARDYQAENIAERIARLKRACFTIRVGGSTETELKERKTRVQDALNSARSAYADGVVKGGGLALYAAGHLADHPPIGGACLVPAAQLAHNAGKTTEQWLTSVEPLSDVIDPARVVIEAVRNATAQAIQVLLVETLIIDPEVNE